MRVSVCNACVVSAETCVLFYHGIPSRHCYVLVGIACILPTGRSCRLGCPPKLCILHIIGKQNTVLSPLCRCLIAQAACCCRYLPAIRDVQLHTKWQQCKRTIQLELEASRDLSVKMEGLKNPSFASQGGPPTRFMKPEISPDRLFQDGLRQPHIAHTAAVQGDPDVWAPPPAVGAPVRIGPCSSTPCYLWDAGCEAPCSSLIYSI